MSDPYVYHAGDPDCPHDNVTQSSLTTSPPISEWRCTNCGRVVRQNVEPTKTVMPEVKQVFDPDKYPYARMRLEDRYLYRSDYLHGEDETIPEEFQVTDDILRAFQKHDWYRAFYEIRMDARYNLDTGKVELIGVDGVKLEQPVVLMT